MSEPSPPAESYSKAFETFVPESDDLVGLLAYANYKASIRERVRDGIIVPHAHRNPTRTEAAAYRGQAERALERYAAKVIEDATPGIVASAQSGAKDEIITEIQKRTGLAANIISGVVVWVVTIVLSLIVVFGAPQWVKAIVDHATSR